MNIKDAKQQVMDTVRAYLATDDLGEHLIEDSKQRPLFLLGAPGIGKTAIMAQVAQEMGIGLVAYSMTHHTRQSALGLPHIVHHAYDGFEYDASEYTMSEIVSSVYDFMERTGLESGILFLDEINCVSETLYPSMLQFLQFKTFGTHRIPNGWVVVCAGNPPEYNRSVHDFDIVTLDRLRKVSIEPDLLAWREYAVNAGIHPAILSFLDVKKNRFYAVEATPEGKTFVTARGWEDLSQTMKAFEAMGIPVDKQLVEQFLQKDDIAEDFALYYELFNKYRSDYQVDAILSGAAGVDIYDRAQRAKLDERLALLGLMLDGLTDDCQAVMDADAAISKVRDMLRSVKPSLMDGANAADALKPRMKEIDAQIAAAQESRTLSSGEMRCLRTTRAKLVELSQTCQLEDRISGAAAFDAMQSTYRNWVEEFKRTVGAAQTSIGNAYAFIDGAFDDGREGLIFTTELTARNVTAHVIAKFGCPSYYEHNKGILVDENQQELSSRVSELLDGLDLPIAPLT